MKKVQRVLLFALAFGLSACAKQKADDVEVQSECEKVVDFSEGQMAKCKALRLDNEIIRSCNQVLNLGADEKLHCLAHASATKADVQIVRLCVNESYISGHDGNRTFSLGDFNQCVSNTSGRNSGLVDSCIQKMSGRSRVACIEAASPNFRADQFDACNLSLEFPKYPNSSADEDKVHVSLSEDQVIRCISTDRSVDKILPCWENAKYNLYDSYQSISDIQKKVVQCILYRRL